MAAILFFFQNLLSFQEFLELDNALENSNRSRAETGLEQKRTKLGFGFKTNLIEVHLDGSRLTQNFRIGQTFCVYRRENRILQQSL